MATKSRFAQPEVQPVRKIRAPKAKPTVVEEPKAEPQTSPDTLFERMRESADAYFASIAVPSWTRRVASIVLGIVAYASTFYGVMQLVDVLCMGVIAYSGVGFLSFIVAFLGVLGAIMAGAWTGTKMYEFAMSFDAKRVKNSVTTFFGKFARRFEPEVSHA